MPVEDSGGSGASVPAQILVATVPPDDAGAETLDRFEWQCAMATADVLALYEQSLSGSCHDAHELICEHHEDWSLRGETDAEIVSAKHLERKFGTYSTLKQLLDEGGVLHLFDRWIALQRSPLCRVVTTPVLDGDAEKFEKACAHFRGQSGDVLDFGQHAELMTKLVTEVDKRRALKSDSGTGDVADPAQDPASLAAFMRVLRLDHGRPFRDDLRYAAAERYAVPLAQHLGKPDAAGAIWTAVLNVVRERMRAAGPTPRAELPLVLGAADEEGYEARSLTLGEVGVIVEVAVNNTAGLAPLPKPLRTSRVAVKMAVGGCHETTIGRAERLRLQFKTYWRTVGSGPGRAAQQQRVDNVLHQIAENETILVANESGPWGQALWSSVQKRMDVLETAPKAQGLDADLLMGGVAELANNCLVWFSEGFNADEVARRLAEEASS